MLIFTLLFLFTASTLYLMLRNRGATWQAWFALGIVALVSWMCSVGAFALALENTTEASSISWLAKMLIAGFILYPFVLWMASRSFERGRNT